MGEIKTKHGIMILSFTILSILAFVLSSWTQTPEILGCYSMDGKTFHQFGESWTEVYNGVVYDCKCIRPSGTPVCKPRGQSNSSPQSQGGSSVTPEQQLAQGIANFFVGLIFPKKQNTSHQAEIDRQNAIKRQQAEELENQRQLQLQQEQELARQKKFAQEKGQLLDSFKDTSTGALGLKGASLPTSELKLKTGTDFSQGDADDLRGKQGIVGSLKTSEEQAEFEKSPAAWNKNQGKLIQQRLQEPNKWCSGIQAHLMGNVPPLPAKTFNELQPGDVLLLEGKAIAYVDNKFTSGGNASSASHTIIFLKEVNGKKYFLDNQPAPVNWGKGGPRIIDEDEYKKVYGQRGAEVARLVGQPLNKEEGEKLFHAAEEMAQKNRKKIANNFFGSGYLGTNYGVKGDDIVCSESDWALLNIAIKETRGQIQKTGDQTKVEWGINWSPADFQNQRYFLVTPLIMPK